MDRIIAELPAEIDGDLMLCRAAGIAYQRDMAQRVIYDAAYFDKCAGYEGQEIARKINAGRAALVNAHVGAEEEVLDIGIGSGEFITLRPHTFGYDVNPKGMRWLVERGLCTDRPWKEFRAFTFWDVLEHVENPQGYFDRMATGAFVFACLPIFADLGAIRASRHYRPGEHLYYFTDAGFVAWMGRYGFALIERADHETAAGRDSIVSYAFRRGHDAAAG